MFPRSTPCSTRFPLCSQRNSLTRCTATNLVESWDLVPSANLHRLCRMIKGRSGRTGLMVLMCHTSLPRCETLAIYIILHIVGAIPNIPLWEEVITIQYLAVPASLRSRINLINLFTRILALSATNIPLLHKAPI